MCQYPIAEYVDFHAKMYSILKADGKNLRKAKGVKKQVVKKNICHNQYKEALFEMKTFHHSLSCCDLRALYLWAAPKQGVAVSI